MDPWLLCCLIFQRSNSVVGLTLQFWAMNDVMELFARSRGSKVSPKLQTDISASGTCSWRPSARATCVTSPPFICPSDSLCFQTPDWECVKRPITTHIFWTIKDLNLTIFQVQHALATPLPRRKTLSKRTKASSALCLSTRRMEHSVFHRRKLLIFQSFDSKFEISLSQFLVQNAKPCRPVFALLSVSKPQAAQI